MQWGRGDIPCWKVKNCVGGTSFNRSHRSGLNSMASGPHISEDMLITNVGKWIIVSLAIGMPSYMSSQLACRAVMGTITLSRNTKNRNPRSRNTTSAKKDTWEIWGREGDGGRKREYLEGRPGGLLWRRCLDTSSDRVGRLWGVWRGRILFLGWSGFLCGGGIVFQGVDWVPIMPIPVPWK